MSRPTNRTDTDERPSLILDLLEIEMLQQQELVNREGDVFLGVQ